MKNLKTIALAVLIANGLPAQGIFESAGSAPAATAENSGLAISGFVRSTAYINRIGKNDGPQLQSGYGEAALKFQATAGDWADGFTELRFRRGHEYGSEIAEFDISEAYVNAAWWKFDLRCGQQIVVWGRADGFNPTNNITPQNTTVRSPDPDDIRGANFLLRTHFNLSPALRLEAIWVPEYSPTVLAFELADLPQNIAIGPGVYPAAGLENSLRAGRLSLELPAFDGSISYVSGYNPMPGIKLTAVDMNTGAVTIAPAAYKQQVFGFDFSTAVGSWGLRGEAAYRIPEETHNSFPNYYIPCEDAYYVIGIDRIWGDLNLIAQYIGRYLPDFADLDLTANPIYGPLENYNRLFANQTDQWRHAISFRPAYSLFYETLSLELFGMYDLTTSEMMLIPQLVYKPADAFTITAGGNIYSGDSGTLYDLIEDSYNAVYFELKIAF
ncbi:MAG: DUF1302 family protein [Candidatus Neomarinimicrobiota bacterium]